jgi:hypothetical protein
MHLKQLEMEENKNRFRTDTWKKDSWQSVDYYNTWFMSCAPNAYKVARKGVTKKVIAAFHLLDQLKNITIEKIQENPSILSVLRACTCPPLAVDRLAGLSYTNRNFITRLENGKLPTKIEECDLNVKLEKIIETIARLLDMEMFPWLLTETIPSAQAINRSAAVIADRISGTLADPIIRNSQEERQLDAIDTYLKAKGYKYLQSSNITDFRRMPDGTFTHHLNVPVVMGNGKVNMPIDVVVKKVNCDEQLPLLIECKSAGDFANTNKRRKEEAMKVSQLRDTYGCDIQFILFLCGYFDTSYLGYEASERIDWIWEHRISDFTAFGI